MKRPNKLTFDIETASTGALICIGFAFRDGEQIQSGYFSNWNHFFKFLIQIYPRKIYAHYGGGFDFNFILQWLRDQPELILNGFLEVSGLIYSMTITSKLTDQNFDFYDSFPLWRKGLDDVGKALVGEQKTHKNLNKSALEFEDKEEVIDYCIDDCVLLLKCLEEFENELMIGELPLSAPACALKHFQTYHLAPENKPFKGLFPRNMHHIQTMRSWYFGGHTEVYKMYGENLYEYDIVNCYGYSMREFGAPIGQPRWVSNRQSDKAGFYIVSVPYFSQHPHLCIRIDNKLLFANTSDDLFATELDLRFFDQWNIPYKVKYGYVFHWDQNFFGNYVDYWYAKRFESKKLGFIAKLMINSLYGKFGTNPLRKNSATIIKEGEQYNGDWYDKVLRIGRTDNRIYSWYVRPEIAAWVTSGARCLLHSFLYSFISNGANVHYMDTDSIKCDKDFTNDVTKNWLTNTKELGKLELEKKIKRAYYLAPKFYAEIDENDQFEIKAKGFHFERYNNTGKILYPWTEIDFQQALRSNHIFQSEQQFIAKFKRSLKSTGDYVMYGSMLKQVRQFGLKRKRIGFNTQPFFIQKGKIKNISI